LAKILNQSKVSLKDTAAVNATRPAISLKLKSFQIPITEWSGGRTKFNRTKQNYPKAHWIDAACIGETGENVLIDPFSSPLFIRATGRGSRQYCRMDKFGFPRTSAKKQKSVHGFKTGDIVKAIVPKGVNVGTYLGRVIIRLSGYFDINISTAKIGNINYKYCKKVQCADGYSYYKIQPPV
jgi:hypothetical protein